MRLLTLVLAGLAFGVIASGCDASSSEGVAQPGTTRTTEATTASGSGDAVAYAVCMRRNGVTRFPDPDADGNFDYDKDLVVGSPRFAGAVNACRDLLPRRPAPSLRQLAEALRLGVRYSACIRAHGVPRFPDPVASAQGELRLDLDAARVDEDSPQLQAAERACLTLGRGMKNALP